VDTARPFQVAAAFPVDGQGSLVAMEVTLSQLGKPCNVSVRLDSYDGMAELSRALEAGMTPIVSYWSANDMGWMDGKGADGMGPCAVGDVNYSKACSETATFHNFSVAPIGPHWPPPPASAARGHAVDQTSQLTQNAAGDVDCPRANTYPCHLMAKGGYDSCCQDVDGVVHIVPHYECTGTKFLTDMCTSGYCCKKGFWDKARRHFCLAC
jgi:hypothetical protein